MNTDFDYTGYKIEYSNILSGLTQEKIEKEIVDKLTQMIVIGERKYNYL
jgi:hypothetical protein